MRIISVTKGATTPTSLSTTLGEAHQAPLKASHPGGRATKILYLERIKSHIDRARVHIRQGDRRVISPEAMLWVERAIPCATTNTLDVLRGIEGILARGIPPVPENPKELENLRSAFSQWHTRAKELWSRGDGRLLPRTAYQAADTNPMTATSAELKAAIVAIGGTL